MCLRPLRDNLEKVWIVAFTKDRAANIRIMLVRDLASGEWSFPGGSVKTGHKETFAKLSPVAKDNYKMAEAIREWNEETGGGICFDHQNNKFVASYIGTFDIVDKLDDRDVKIWHTIYFVDITATMYRRYSTNLKRRKHILPTGPEIAICESRMVNDTAAKDRRFDNNEVSELMFVDLIDINDFRVDMWSTTQRFINSCSYFHEFFALLVQTKAQAKLNLRSTG
jgi:8-oxo-dGTP pyrophosphatase MutT (NUDIX family)